MGEQPMKTVIKTMAIAAAGALGVWVALRATRRNDTPTAAAHSVETWEGEGGLLSSAPATFATIAHGDFAPH
jgi:hypothetical protein